MLTLTKLRMKNFKSFRNAQIPFTAGFTAIAGANGSGKSNIMDAVLFALGETSLKSLRAARLTDLVHSGTATGDNYAVVTLTLQGKDQTYELSRMIDKQGKSVYRLNEKRVTLSEIQNLLHELGLRVDGHNLVSQGDLLRIIDMNPVERRQLIDEVAGIQEFEEKKNEAVRDLDKVDRKIKDVTIVLNERMAIIEQLGRERDAATRFKKLEKELRETKSTILHLESHELNQKLEGLVSKQVELIEKKEEAVQKQQSSRKIIVESEKEFSELDAQVLGVKNLAFGGLGKSVEEHRADIRILDERIKHTLTRIKELETQLGEAEKETKEHSTLAQKYPNVHEAKEKMLKQLSTLEKQLAEHAGEAFAHQESLKQLEATKSKCPICDRELTAKLKQKIAEEKKDLHAHAEKKVHSHTAQRKTISEEISQLQRAEIMLAHYEKSTQHVHKLGEEIKTFTKNKKEMEKKHEEMKKELLSVEKKYENEMSVNKELLEKREKVQQKLAIERERERAWQEKVFRIEGQVSELKIEQSKFDTRLIDVKEELKNFEGVGTLHEKDTMDLKKRIPVLEHEIRQLGTVNMKALEDFGQYEKDVLEIREKAKTLETERLAVLDLINGIELKRNEAFMKTFNAINTNFNMLYTSFFNGTAKLELTNPQKPLESGLIVEAKHGIEKFLKNIDSMSGGEKSLTSLAFIFSIQLFEPAPFYFFDEVDAALDMTNSKKVGELIKEMSKASQFISITHNDSIVKVADQILGVTKSGGTHSSVIGLKNAAEVKVVGQN